MAKKYYWLKLQTDFFTSKAMKKLRKIAGGDTYTIIYLKLQLLSLNDNGALHYEGVEPTFAEEMALALDEDAENVKITLMFLENMGLLEQQNENEFILNEVPYLVGSETDKAALMRQKRAREKAAGITQNGNNVTAMLPDVTTCYTEREKEKEKIREDREKKRERTEYQLIVDIYNDTCVSFPRVTALSETRKKAIKARLNVYSLEDFKQLFTLAEQSNFLKGGNSRNWQANFDWLIKDANMAKVLDGNYNNNTSSKNIMQQQTTNTAQQLNNFYDMTAQWANEESEV